MDDRLKGSEKSALAFSTLGYFLGFAGVALFGPLSVVFKPLLELSPSTLGFFVAIPTLTGALLRIPFGALVDRYGGKRPTLVLLALSSGGLLGLSVLLLRYYPSGISPGSLPLMLLIGGMVGAGIATSSVSLVQTSYWFPPDRLGGRSGDLRWLGEHGARILHPAPPRGVCGPGARRVVSGLVCHRVRGAILYWVLAQDPHHFQLRRLRQRRRRAPEMGPPLDGPSNPPGRFTDSLWESARRGENWALVATNFATFGGFLALTAWLPTYWAVYHGLSIPVAAFFTAVGFTLFGAFMRVLGGFASDLHGGETVQLLNHALVVVGALTLFLSGTSIGASILGELILAAGMGMANGGVYKLIPRYMPESLGGATGWVGGIGSLGGFVIPPVLGFVVGEFGDVGYSQGFVLFVGLGLMSFGISLWLRARRHRRL